LSNKRLWTGMDGVQIFRSGNMCDTPCGLAAQILALSWRSPTLIELLEAAERTFYVELSDVTVMAWLRTRPRRLWTADRACRRICAGQAVCEPISDTPPKFQRSTSLALFLQPNEMILDPWRVRKLRKEPLAAEHPGAALNGRRRDWIMHTRPQPEPSTLGPVPSEILKDVVERAMTRDIRFHRHFR